jgi:hypothetical protein
LEEERGRKRVSETKEGGINIKKDGSRGKKIARRMGNGLELRYRPAFGKSAEGLCHGYLDIPVGPASQMGNHDEVTEMC